MLFTNSKGFLAQKYTYTELGQKYDLIPMNWSLVGYFKQNKSLESFLIFNSIKKKIHRICLEGDLPWWKMAVYFLWKHKS